MKFSVLISSYNKSRYLEECIVSCLSQTFELVEIVLLDNYSNDGTKEILDKYKNKIKIIYKKKISKFSPLNQIDLVKEGMHSCSGDIICLLDADDYFLPEKIYRLNEIYKNNSVEVVFDIPFIKFNEKYNKLKLKNKIQSNIWPTIINTSAISLKKSYLKSCIESKLFENYNLLEIDFRLNAISRCIDNNFVIFNEPLSVYRVVPNSIMSNARKFSKNWWLRRKQAHDYMKMIYKLNNKVYSNFVDSKITGLITKFYN